MFFFSFFLVAVILTDEWKIMSDKLSEANSVKCEAQVCIGMRIMNKLINFLHDAFFVHGQYYYS